MSGKRQALIEAVAEELKRDGVHCRLVDGVLLVGKAKDIKLGTTQEERDNLMAMCVSATEFGLEGKFSLFDPVWLKKLLTDFEQLLPSEVPF